MFKHATTWRATGVATQHLNGLLTKLERSRNDIVGDVEGSLRGQ